MARPRPRSLVAAILVLLAPLLAVRAASAGFADDVPAFTGGALDDRLTGWLDDPFVTEALHGGDFRGLTASLRDLPGFAGAYPDAGGGYVAKWHGRVPAGAPRASKDGHPVDHVAHARIRPLIGRASEEAHAISVSDLAEETEEPPPVVTPGPVQGIGPGGPIQMRKADAAGTLNTYICSASYLFQDRSSGTYYLATAGHCLLDANVGSSTDDPTGRARWVRLCYADCINNSLSIGEYVQLNPDDAYPGYHPVAWAEQRGIGRDFGLIEIPQALNEHLRPWLWLWGGPTRFARPFVGTPLTHYGFGIGLGQATPTQGRLAVSILSSSVDHAAIGWVNGGDSGSAFGTAAARTDALLLGDGATGVITHAVAGVGFPLMWGTDLQSALGTSAGALGFRPELVLEDGTVGGEPAQPTASPSPSAGPSPTSSPTPSAPPSPSATASPTADPTPTPTPTPEVSPTPTPEPTPTPTPDPTPPPTSSPSPSPEPSASPDAPAPAPREISLRASRKQVRPGRLVRLKGTLSGEAGCFEDQRVALRARRAGNGRFRNVATVRTNADGAFVVRVRPRVSRAYRAVAPASDGCTRAASRIVKVRVKR